MSLGPTGMSLDTRIYRHLHGSGAAASPHDELPSYLFPVQGHRDGHRAGATSSLLLGHFRDIPASLLGETAGLSPPGGRGLGIPLPAAGNKGAMGPPEGSSGRLCVRGGGQQCPHVSPAPSGAGSPLVAQLWGRDSGQRMALCHSVSPQVTQPCHCKGAVGVWPLWLWLVMLCHPMSPHHGGSGSQQPPCVIPPRH